MPALDHLSIRWFKLLKVSGLAGQRGWESKGLPTPRLSSDRCARYAETAAAHAVGRTTDLREVTRVTSPFSETTKSVVTAETSAVTVMPFTA